MATASEGPVLLQHDPADQRLNLPDLPTGNSVSIASSNDCLQMFHLDDYELAVLQEGHCPFCRIPYEIQDNSHNAIDDLDLPLL